MKTTISTFAIIALLATGAMAQRNNGPAYGPGQNDRYPNTVQQGNAHADDTIDAYKIDQIDQLVHLSRQQKKEIKRIENSYDKLASTPSAYRNPQAFQRQKQQAIMAVLTPVQRNTLFAYQNQSRRGGSYGRRG